MGDHRPSPNATRRRAAGHGGRRWTRCLPALVAVLCGLACSPGDPLPRRPHPIIIVDIDTLRADHLGCYGYGRPTSPSIDAFARESLRFEWAFSQAPNTPPSQTSILTGLYPSTHGMVYDEDRVPEEVVTLAEALAAAGYSTAGFHDGGYMRDVFRIGQGFALYEDSKGQGLAASGPRAIEWLREHADQSFLLFVHTYDTHTPYAPRPPFDEMFMDGVPEPTPGFSPDTETMEKVRLSKYTDTLLTLPPNDIAHAIALYDGEIRFVDTWFGELWSVVRELGLDQRATVVVLSDHGEEFQEHGSVLHEKLYATVTRIPFIIRLPGGRLARPVAEIVESIDLMPTLLELAGVRVPEGVQGESLLPIILGQDSDGLHVAFSESPFFGRNRAVALGRHHLILTRKNSSAELYDLVDDPLEQDDLAGDRPPELEAMIGLQKGWEERVARSTYATSGEAAPLDEETLEQLRRLGYIR
jgi:arylsulfatase A-like enzyme